MDCAAIHRLRLKEAFGDMQKFQTVTCDAELLAELFEWTTRGVIFVYDDDEAGHSVFVADTRGLGSDKTFRVLNTDHKDLFLWHIDGVMYRKGSKCDCAFLADRRLGFIEFKSNAANNSDEAIKANYEKATMQMRLTIGDVIDRCRNAGIDVMASTMVEAYAVFNPTVPRHNAYQKKIAARFLMETDGIPLYFKNSVEI